MEIHDKELDEALERVSKYDAGYLFYLLGSSVEPEFQTQGAGRVQGAGKSFFERFRSELRRAVCGKNGPYEQLIKGIATKKDLPKLVAIAILSGVPTLGGVAVTTVIAAYLALLIIQSGLAAYCAGGQDDELRRTYKG
jgi:hypothetical protein